MAGEKRYTVEKSKPEDVLPVIRCSGEDFARLCSDDAAVDIKTSNLKWKGSFEKLANTTEFN